MRPIDQLAGDRKAVMWRADDFAKTFDRLPVSVDLHRYAGRVYTISCMPKRSAIDRRYYAEGNRYLGEGRMLTNVKLGRGDNPVAAAIDAYRQMEPADPIWDAFALELECELLRRSIVHVREIERQIDRAVDGLTDLIRSYIVPLTQQPGEDDDL